VDQQHVECLDNGTYIRLFGQFAATEGLMSPSPPPLSVQMSATCVYPVTMFNSTTFSVIITNRRSQQTLPRFSIGVCKTNDPLRNPVLAMDEMGFMSCTFNGDISHVVEWCEPMNLATHNSIRITVTYDTQTNCIYFFRNQVIVAQAPVPVALVNTWQPVVRVFGPCTIQLIDVDPLPLLSIKTL
jgi:hypothetical protein